MHLAWAVRGGGDGSSGAAAAGSTLDITGPDAAELARCGPGQLAVVPAGALSTPAAIVPMAGRWIADDAVLRFTSAFPFATNTTYVLVRRQSQSDLPAEQWSELGRLVRTGARAENSTRVVAIHPTADEVPRNVLRLSITFSAPMEEGWVSEHVHLQDAGTGVELSQALLPMPPELWDRTRTRLTVLLEPGRTKRGLVPNTELGAPLAQTTSVVLVVDEDLRDACGARLAAGARRTYRVGTAVRARVDPASWHVTWPAAGTIDPLVVLFDRPLDHALLVRCLHVSDPAGSPVNGCARIGDGDVEWSFTPVRPWPTRGCMLIVNTDLEDLAGNSVRRVFDRDLRRPQDDPLDVAHVVLIDHAAAAVPPARTESRTAPPSQPQSSRPPRRNRSRSPAQKSDQPPLPVCVRDVAS